MFIYKICSMYNVMEDTAMGGDADSVAGRLFISRFYHNSVLLSLCSSLYGGLGHCSFKSGARFNCQGPL